MTSPARQWEYRMLTAHVREDEGGLDELKAAGRDGWEAISMSVNGRHIVVLLKRPRGDDTDHNIKP